MKIIKDINRNHLKIKYSIVVIVIFFSPCTHMITYAKSIQMENNDYFLTYGFDFLDLNLTTTNGEIHYTDLQNLHNLYQNGNLRKWIDTASLNLSFTKINSYDYNCCVQLHIPTKDLVGFIMYNSKENFYYSSENVENHLYIPIILSQNIDDITHYRFMTINSSGLTDVYTNPSDIRDSEDLTFQFLNKQQKIQTFTIFPQYPSGWKYPQDEKIYSGDWFPSKYEKISKIALDLNFLWRSFTIFLNSTTLELMNSTSACEIILANSDIEFQIMNNSDSTDAIILAVTILGIPLILTVIWKRKRRQTRMKYKLNLKKKER